MLHKNTVERETFELLNKLMQDEKLSSFHLAGGTALALYLGHRLSIDLDLFSPSDFSAQELEKYLVDKYNFRGNYLENNTLKGEIEGVKIDCITHSSPFVENVANVEGIRLYSAQDIAAMKLSAIADNGTRLKDFVDIAFLSSKIPLMKMLEAYEKKYTNANKMRPVKGLLYYDDINRKEPIRLINGKYDWKQIEKRLQDMIKSPNLTFSQYPNML